MFSGACFDAFEIYFRYSFSGASLVLMLTSVASAARLLEEFSAALKFLRSVEFIHKYLWELILFIANEIFNSSSIVSRKIFSIGAACKKKEKRS